MYKIIIPDIRIISPFNESARDSRIQNTPLWLHQRKVLAPYTTREKELEPKEHLPNERVEMIVYRKNLSFDEGYINAYMATVCKKDKAVCSAFSSEGVGVVEDPGHRDEPAACVALHDSGEGVHPGRADHRACELHTGLIILRTDDASGRRPYFGRAGAD